MIKNMNRDSMLAYALECARELRARQEEYLNSPYNGRCFHGISRMVVCWQCESSDALTPWTDPYAYGLSVARAEQKRRRFEYQVSERVSMLVRHATQDEVGAIITVLRLLETN